MLRIKSGCIFILLVISVPILCRAQVKSDQALQEVFRTELVYTQDRGELQLTTGFSPTWSQSTLLQWPLQIEYGLTNAWQVQIESDGWQRRMQLGQPVVSGLGDLSLGTK